MRRPLLASALAALLALTTAACQTPAPGGQPVRVVFFTEDSAALDDTGRTVLREAAEDARANPRGPVVVSGYAGPAGGQAYNRALSEARARHVADILVGNGVSAGRIVIRPRGPTAFELMPTESRRVEVRIGG